MSCTYQLALFAPKAQPQLFDAPPVAYRARLHKILAEARGAQAWAWDAGRVSLYRTIVPQMTLWLPEDEAAQLRFAFDAEMARLAPDSAKQR